MNGKTDVSKRKRVVVLRKYGRSNSHQSLEFTFLKMAEKSQKPHIFPWIAPIKSSHFTISHHITL
jgi:hypothetical protein